MGASRASARGPLLLGATHVHTVPATGRHVTVHACDVYEVKDNKIKEGRAYLDTGAIMSQLGLTEQLQG